MLAYASLALNAALVVLLVWSWRRNRPLAARCRVLETTNQAIVHQIALRGDKKAKRLVNAAIIDVRQNIEKYVEGAHHGKEQAEAAEG